jgi:hypothetical protein
MSTPANASSTTRESRELLRHSLATLAYRGGKAIRGAPTGFEDFSAGGKARTPGQILAHMGDLFDWALSFASGKEAWHNSKALPWDEQADRFFAALTAFDEFLASGAPLAASPERLLQGPIADAFTHVGQLTILRRLAGAPVLGEDYSVAEIKAGRVGKDQTPPAREFGG